MLSEETTVRHILTMTGPLDNHDGVPWAYVVDSCHLLPVEGLGKRETDLHLLMLPTTQLATCRSSWCLQHHFWHQ